MNDFNYLFSPLDKKYCLYFYWLSVIGFICVILTIIAFMWIGLSKKLGIEHYIHMVSLALGYFIFGYFHNRLLYSMCARGM
jgi:hypothetical protein